MANIGFIGLGIMGKPMAGNLIKGGHKLFLNSRSGVAPELISAGGVSCASAKEVAQKADIIITMVPDTPDVDRVLFGASGVAEGLTKGKTVVDMSSISPIETKGYASRINALGCEYLDAPVKRVCALDTFVAYAPQLEDAILPQVSDVAKAISEIKSY